MSFKASTRSLDSTTTVFSIEGRLNLGTNLMFAEIELKKLIESGVKNIILDLAGLSFIDSAGVGMIITTAGTLEKAGGKLAIAGSQGIVAQTFGIVHMQRIVPIFESVDTAKKEMEN